MIGLNTEDFIGTGTMIVALKHIERMALLREMLKRS